MGSRGRDEIPSRHEGADPDPLQSEKGGQLGAPRAVTSQAPGLQPRAFS